MAMPGFDLDAAAKEAGAVAERLEELAKQAAALQRELARTAEEQALAAVKVFVAEDKQEEAMALVKRAFRILDEVGDWVASQGYVGLAQRLAPELRAGYEEVQAFLASPRVGGNGGPARP